MAGFPPGLYCRRKRNDCSKWEWVADTAPVPGCAAALLGPGTHMAARRPTAASGSAGDAAEHGTGGDELVVRAEHGVPAPP